MEKIVDAKEVKIYKTKYYCDGGTLKLTCSTDKSINLCNNTGDGEYDLYIVNAVGWGPVHFVDKEDYNKLNEFERFMDSMHIGFIHESGWKVLYYDLDNFDDDGIMLNSTMNFISIQKSKDAFIIYVYQRNTNDVDIYDMYLMHLDEYWEN